jgi:Icc protein
MPLSLPPISRRRFLAGSLAAAAGLAAGRGWGDAAEIDPHRFVLVSDTHIAARRDQVVRETNMFENFRRAGEALTALSPRPAALLHHGDGAYLDGQPDDYAALLDLLRPIRERGLPVHMALGNHDHRENFWKAFEAADENERPVEKKHVAVVEAERVNFFLLDTLDVVNKTPGAVGESQLRWLAATLDKRADKPAIVLAHHDPDEREKPSGLTDTKALLDVLLPRKHVKAYLYGHTHAWKVAEREGLHLVNLPPVAYVFVKERPNGWVDLALGENGAKVVLNCLDAAHPQHGETFELKWRA